MTINEVPILTPLPEYLTVVYMNGSDCKRYTYGEAFQLEKKIKNGWYTFPEIEGYGVHLIAYSLDPLSSNEVKCYVSQYHENMGAGLYRIVCQIEDVTSQVEGGPKQKYNENYQNVICEFSIE